MADEQGAIPEALERLFDQAFTDGIAAGKSDDESILAGSSTVYAQSALTIVAADRLADTGEVIDLDKLAWRSIQEAAAQSSWMPAEYVANDWISDVCMFLRDGPVTHKTADAGAMREGVRKLLLDRAVYFESAKGYREWKDAARSYRATADEVDKLFARNLPDAGEPL